MDKRFSRSLDCLLIAAALGASGCAHSLVRRFASPAEVGSLDRKSPYLKVHALDGSVYLLSQWSVDSTSKTVSGFGRLMDANRAIVGSEQSFTVPIDSVSLFETNVTRTHPAVTAMAIVTGISVVVTALCLSDPKACFGSCPTFYAWDGDKFALQAEGFSASVLPALEATDIDALYHARPPTREFEVRMKNEALETHVVRSVDLLAAPRPEHGRVFHTVGGEFWQARNLLAPTTARAPEGDCLAALRDLDGNERFSRADSVNLARREFLDLTFPAPECEHAGIVIGTRQTLLTTFLLYQELAWMGGSAGNILSALNRSNPRARANRIRQALGGIEVLIRDRAGRWTRAGEITETGPLATDVFVVPIAFPRADSVHVRLRMTRGHWRLDYVALAELTERVAPLRLRPDAVLRGDLRDDEARAQLLDPERVLTTIRGDEYRLLYRLPEDFERYELFLEARGYYLEWMRTEWLAEEDPSRAIGMFLNPARALRELAPKFARGETEREAVFWGSRYARP